MFRFFGQVLLWLQGGSLKLLTIAGLILLVWGVLSPIGTLSWWVQQGARYTGLSQDAPPPLLRGDRTSSSADPIIRCYVVFLTGVGDFSANQMAPGEELFLTRLVQSHPGCVAVRTVFPYSAANEGLSGHRWLAPLWRFAEDAEGWLENLNVLIRIRNLWRFAISVDDRYGPVYNRGIASAIVEGMHEASPLDASTEEPIQIILIGTSGGAQVALGAVRYLDRWLETDITVVSIGGVFAGSHGFGTVEQVYHLQGQKDWIEDLGWIVFPSRWPWTVGSPFNQAQRQGRYHERTIGPQAHDGEDGYFGMNLAKSNGDTYLDLTVRAVNQLPIWSSQK